MGAALPATATVSCPHGGRATITPSQTRVRIGGNPVAVVSDSTTVAGCSFQVPAGAGTKPQPCVKVLWSAPALRVKASGKAVLVDTSTGVCQSVEQIPQGAPTIAPPAQRVRAT